MTKKELRIKRDEELNKNRTIFETYCDMEGMYGKKIFSPYDCGHGLTGYHFEYPSKEVEEKERAERENFLKINNWRPQNKIWYDYYEQVEKLRK